VKDFDGCRSVQPCPALRVPKHAGARDWRQAPAIFAQPRSLFHFIRTTFSTARYLSSPHQRILALPTMSSHDQVEHHLIQALGHEQHHDPDDTTDPALTGADPPPQPAVPIVQSLQPTNTAKDPFSVLSRIPPDIAQVRQQLFLLEEPVEFSQADWEKYWPYVIAFAGPICCLS
jgi:hypothetical protein